MSNLARLNREPDLPLCDQQALSLLDKIDLAVWIYDLTLHRVPWANQAALRFWKAGSVSELAERDFVPTSVGTAERLENLGHRLSRGEQVHDQWTLYPLGQPSRLRCKFTGVRLPQGGLGMMIEARPDGPDQVDGGFELRALEAVRQAPLMISLVSLNGHWLMHNAAAESLMHSLGQHNIPNMDNFLALFVDAELAAARREEAVQRGSAQATLRMAGTEFRMHDVTIRRSTDPVTGQLSLIVSQQDVTHAYKLERRLQKALERERAIVEIQRDFLSITSHDFRTPLSIIDGAARRIEKLAGDEGTIADRVRAIRKAVSRMSTAVDNTLSAAGIAAGKIAFHPQRQDIRPIIEDAIATQNSLHPDRAFRTEIPYLSQVSIDATLVEQVFENVLSNAVKYSPDDSVITIAATLQAKAIVISVTDHGIGVPEDEIPKLFTRFFRSRNTRGVKGTGVGLHAVRYFMDLHKGTVAMASREGIGSTVTVTFPLPDA